MSLTVRRAWLLAVVGACAACQQAGAGAAPTATKPTLSSPVVATVNGAPITEAELAAALKPSAHGGEAAPGDRRKVALDGLVRDELLRQEAERQGLAPDPAALEEVARLEAAVVVARRKASAEAWVREVLKKAEPTEAEARAFFERNGELLKSEYHVQQLFLRDEAAITKAQQDLEAGAAFEDVARRQFPELPPGAGTPWDLGFLAFKQLPEPWRPVLGALKAGEVSGILKGPNGRFWLVRLVEKRPAANATFEALRPLIVEDLKRARLEQVVTEAEAALRAKAQVKVP